MVHDAALHTSRPNKQTTTMYNIIMYANPLGATSTVSVAMYNSTERYIVLFRNIVQNAS